MAKDSQKISSDLDKVEDYFKQKSILKTLRADLKDYRSQLEEVKELESLTKKVKNLREKIKEDKTIIDLTEKISGIRERIELLKELIRIDLLESNRQEIKRNGRKLKLVSILKEMKDDEAQKQNSNQSNPNRNIFRS